MSPTWYQVLTMDSPEMVCCHQVENGQNEQLFVRGWWSYPIPEPALIGSAMPISPGCRQKKDKNCVPGKELYRERLGGACNSSPIAGDGCIYLSNNAGTTFVVKAGREFQLLGSNSLGERITASPAISGNELSYRTDSHMYCIGTDH
jgi:hypothetical protein